MLANLKSELFRRQMPVKSFAEFLGISEKSARNKLSGSTEFTLSELSKTNKILFPQYNWEYLFATDSEHIQ